MEGGANFVVKVMLETEAVARLMALRNLAGLSGVGRLQESSLPAVPQFGRLRPSFFVFE
jgi:hypothetical protein